MQTPAHGSLGDIASLPLERAEHHFLQVLLSELRLEKFEGSNIPGVHLTVYFDETTAAMWRRQQRVLVKQSIDDFETRAKNIDGELASFLASPGMSEWKIFQPPFVFRYGNGGTLPILRMGDREYYCLAYRDIPPIGWNLANGASDNRHELFNPLTTLERELREEILIIDEGRRIRYVLQWEDDDALDRPEFMLAREFWKRRRGVDIAKFEQRTAPVTWIHGPDAITVKYPGQLPSSTQGIFLNISAADFGVEVDRIARIHVDDGAIVLDGETYGSKLVDRPMGLFEVNRFAAAFSKDKYKSQSEPDFVPDILFVSGDRVEGSRDKIIASLNQACATGNRLLRSTKEDEEWDSCQTKLALCPVAHQLMTRHLAQEALLKHKRGVQARPDQPYRVFISSPGHDDDMAIARAIHSHLVSDRSVGSVFFYKESPLGMEWMRDVEDALKSAEVLIVVCTDVSRVRKLGPLEWQPFFEWKRNGQKQTGEIVPVVHGVEPGNLPLPLCVFDAVFWGPDQLRPLEALSRKIKLATGRGAGAPN